MTPLSSLSNRIFLASAALTVVCMGTAAYLVNARVTQSADIELQRELEQTGAVVDQQRATVSDLFAEIARIVADLPKLKAAVDTNDPPTVQPIAMEYQDQVHSDLFLVTNRAGRLLASVESQGGIESDPTSLASVRDALAGRESAMFRAHPHGVLQVVSVPVTAGGAMLDVLGTLSVGFLLDDGLARRMKILTGSEIAFAAGGRVVASSLAPAERRALDPILKARGISSVSVGGSEYVALARPLAPPQRSSLLADAPHVSQPALDDSLKPVVVILRSRTDRLQFLRPIQTALGVTALGFVLVGIGMSYAIARTITKPLATITATMRDMAATGDLTRKITWPTRRWEDEDARLLASTFNTLTESVTRFQREAAQREPCRRLAGCLR
jgi:HAMP domain-containing protein